MVCHLLSCTVVTCLCSNDFILKPANWICSWDSVIFAFTFLAYMFKVGCVHHSRISASRMSHGAILDCVRFDVTNFETSQ